MLRRLRVALVGGAIGALACGPRVDDGFTADEPNGGAGELGPIEVGGGEGLVIGGRARVVADFLNLRDGIGTAEKILAEMPCGSEVDVLDGPSTTPVAGWWRIDYLGQLGWASGKYLIGSSQFDPISCGADFGPGSAPAVSAMFMRAQLGVGYSYYWGHGSWRADGTQHGTCAGSCPDCQHSGQYGADCSGYVAKIWQVPSPSALEVDQHPYSTYNFYNEETHWRAVPRSEMQPGDAFVRRVDGGGHMGLLHEGTDPFGELWVYEARACATGVVHNLRAIDSSYKFIRRSGL